MGMPRLIPRTIIGQLITGTVVMQAILLGLFLSLTVRHELDDDNARASQRLESQTMLLAHLVQNSLAERDAEQGGVDRLGRRQVGYGMQDRFDSLGGRAAHVHS